MIKFLTISCLAVLILIFFYVLIQIVKRKRPERISYIRRFKKGQCGIIFIPLIPLYCIGFIYAGSDFYNAFFSSIKKVIDLVVLKYDTGNITSLMKDYPLYNFTIYFSFTLVLFNALLFTYSLVCQRIWCFFQSLKSSVTKKDKLFIFGNNKENITIYKSDKKRSKVIIDDISDKDMEKLYMDSVSFISCKNHNTIIDKIEKLIEKLEKSKKVEDKEYIFIINTKDDEKNIEICRSFIQILNSVQTEVKESLFLKLKIFVFGNSQYENIYEDIISAGSGCIHYINKYQKIAIDFIDRYPFSKFMSDEQIDYETSLIKKDIDVNVFLIGFGRNNRNLFLTSVANNQFLTAGSSGPELKKVKYFIFDKDESENNKNLNHNYYRYKYECSMLNPNEYLPLPSLPAEESYYHLNINDSNFYNQIKNIATKSLKNENFVIIAFGSDLENIDMAQKFIEKKKEWGLKNFVIFVKVKKLMKEQVLFKNEDCYFIGNEDEVVYNIEQITSDHIFKMAQMRNEVYDLEYTITSTPNIVVDEKCIQKNHYMANRNWYMKKSQQERDSSLFCCLSLRSKLNLMGLDYCKITDESEGLTEEEYLSIYAGADLPDTTKYNVTANGKKIVNYTLDFKSSRRKNMAIHEHQRWNSFMISKGFIPSSIKQILTEKIVDNEGKERFTNGKNYSIRRHGNLTTFEGLVQFREILATRDNRPEEEKDVIKYDYQLLDDAYWLLKSNGYKIIKKID